MAGAATVAPQASAAPGDEITLTFIRHAESAGNTSGFINTSTPGPGLTDLGWTQAYRTLVDWNGKEF